MDKKGLHILQNMNIKDERNDMLIGINNEDWTKAGIKTAGWMSKHVLWNTQTLHASVADINKKMIYSNGHITINYNSTYL